MIRLNLQEWEARLVGFALPWWCAFLLVFPGAMQEPRAVLGLVGLGIGSLAALWQMASGEEGRSRTVANWFLVGLASIAVALGVAFCLFMPLG